MTENQWKTLFAVAAAIVTFLLVQPEVQKYPVAMIVLGCINVALAAANPIKRVSE